MQIGLPFKADIAIRPVEIQIIKAFEEPLEKVDQVKKDQEEFRLLPQVDALVVDQCLILLEGFVPKDDKRPKTQAHIAAIEQISEYQNHLQ
jgi:hypothetical protein